LVEALDRATSWLAGLDRHDAGQVEHALAERLDAIEALTQWIAAEQQASRPVNPRLAMGLSGRNVSPTASSRNRHCRASSRRRYVCTIRT